jgi:hypothetical protein
MSGVPSATNGVVTAGALGNGYVWITYPNLTSFFCFVGSTALAAFGWYLLAVERKRDTDRRCQLMDQIQAIRVDNIVIASMVERLLPKEEKK